MGDLELYYCQFLFACDDDPSLLPLVERGFKGKGDAEMALEALQRNGKALQRAKLLVGYHASKVTGARVELGTFRVIDIG